ncbi:MAG: hypothetical protein GC199_03140 [Alphaproteobacteria bacterium]|nr:hypothetical protein [Alphaproteobacteria bacterium]
MAPSRRTTVAAVAGPYLLGAFAILLALSAFAAFAAGLSAAMAGRAAPIPDIATTLTLARVALLSLIGAIAIGFALVIWFIKQRVLRPLAYATELAEARARGGADPDNVAVPDSFRSLIDALARLDSAGRNVLPAASREAFAAAVDEIRTAASHLVSLQDSHAQALARTQATHDSAAQQLIHSTRRVTEEAEAIGQIGVALAGRVNETLDGVTAAGAALREAAEETRGHSRTVSGVAAALQPNLEGAVEVLKSAAQFLDRHLAQTHTRLEGLISLAEANGGNVDARFEAALARVGAAGDRLEYEAEALSSSAKLQGGQFASAADSFKAAGLTIVQEAAVLRGTLKDSARDLGVAATALDALLSRVAAPADTSAPSLPAGEAEIDTGASGASEDVVPDFLTASNQILALARSIERIESQTQALAERLSSDPSAAGGDAGELDQRTDETVAALMGSIERMNAIVAAISQAGDAASAGGEPAQQRAMH